MKTRASIAKEFLDKLSLSENVSETFFNRLNRCFPEALDISDKMTVVSEQILNLEQLAKDYSKTDVDAELIKANVDSIRRFQFLLMHAGWNADYNAYHKDFLIIRINLMQIHSLLVAEIKNKIPNFDALERAATDLDSLILELEASKQGNLLTKSRIIDEIRTLIFYLRNPCLDEIENILRLMTETIVKVSKFKADNNSSATKKILNALLSIYIVVHGVKDVQETANWTINSWNEINQLIDSNASLPDYTKKLLLEDQTSKSID